jgi:uncharacterized membrane protein
MESTVQHTLSAPIRHAFSLYSDLNEHPTWSPWLTDVDYDVNSGLSVWKLQKLGLTYTWRANNTRVEAPFIIQWESLNGVPNKGKVEFVAVGGACGNLDVSTPIDTSGVDGIDTDASVERTLMTMTVSYELPEAAALLLRGLGSVATNFINSILARDLARFESRLLRELQDWELQGKLAGGRFETGGEGGEGSRECREQLPVALDLSP